MQIDIVQIGYGLLILFVAGAVTALFAYIYKRSGGAIQARFSRSDGEFQVAIHDCVHTEESGMSYFSSTLDTFQSCSALRIS